jgi:hypothetical protein
MAIYEMLVTRSMPSMSDAKVQAKQRVELNIKYNKF